MLFARRIAFILVVVAFAYSLPALAYSSWAWLPLRPATWSENTPPALDPLGTAWENWRPTQSNTEGDSSYGIATEQGERWRYVMIGSAIVLALSIVGAVTLHATRPIATLPCGSCGYDLLTSIKGRVVACPSCGKEA